MPDINDVLERLVTDSGFRAQLAADPAGALAGYELSADDVQLLAASLDDGGGDLPHGVEQRTSKSALLGLLASFAGAGAGSNPSAADTFAATPAVSGSPLPPGDLAPAGGGQAHGPELEEVGFVFHPVRGPEGGDDLVAPGGVGGEEIPPSAHKIADVTLKRGTFDVGGHDSGGGTPGELTAPEQAGAGDSLDHLDKREDPGAAPAGSDALAPDDGDDAAILVPAVQKVREAPRPETGAQLPDGSLVQEPPTADSEHVNKVDAFTIKQQVTDGDFLTIEDA